MSGSMRQTRPSPISLRLTTEERAVLEQAAGGMNLSAYVRSRLFGDNTTPRRKRRHTPIKDHKSLSKALGMLGHSRIANNLNQLAKAMNMGALPVTPDTESDIKQACTHIQTIKNLLMNALGLSSGGKI